MVVYFNLFNLEFVLLIWLNPVRILKRVCVCERLEVQMPFITLYLLHCCKIKQSGKSDLIKFHMITLFPCSANRLQARCYESVGEMHFTISKISCAYSNLRQPKTTYWLRWNPFTWDLRDTIRSSFITGKYRMLWVRYDPFFDS